ncbi:MULTISPECIES: metallophosphoesterase family protein [Ferrimicrobium]|uniref:Metallophosphoesterase n=1 Tax=Ferrimicrobium acidiphilum TaxID=121039 RepID=A0ABV3Y557_9ACTN|nr:metallophosphoesterase [Ferrimicrobium sp.]
MTRIVHISDLHFELPPERLKPGVRQVLDQSAAILKALQPDFLAVTGDLTSYGCFDRNQLSGVRRWLDGLGLDYLVVPGNHDLSANEIRGAAYPIMETYEPVAWERTNFARSFDQGPLVERTLDQVTVLGVALREGDPDSTLVQLARRLDELSGPALVLGHYPLQVTKEQGVLGTFGYQGYIEGQRDRLLKMLRDQPLVRAYLCGHVHAQTVVPLDDHLRQFSAGSLGLGASAGWIIDITQERLEIRSIRGAGPERFWPDDLCGEQDPLDYHLWCGTEPIVLSLVT